MSDKTFEWTDELVAEFGEYYRKKQGVDYSTWGKCLLDAFKKSKEKDIHKDWEIQEYKYGKYDDYQCIKSVKRLSDGEVFSIGDRIEAREGEYCDWKNRYSIVSISITTGLLAFEIINEKETNPTGSVWREIENIRKPKVPLFTTCDLKDVFDTDTYPIYKVDFNLNMLQFAACDAGNYPHSKYFYDKGKALEYITLNKPIQLSYNELQSLFTEEEIYPYGNFINKLKEFFKSKIDV